MVLERLRDLLGSTDDTTEPGYRCINCGAEFEQSRRECLDCGGPYVAPVDDEHNA